MDPRISIHAPLTGRDRKLIPLKGLLQKFQSTRPLRGATAGTRVHCYPSEFQSTRPLRGATRRWTWRSRRPYNFNPRAPYGARLWNCDSFR